MDDFLTLTRLELLEACNQISLKYGGRSLGTVEGYRNQHLISVELRDMKKWKAFAPLLNEDPDDPVYAMHWIRLGFCQSSITRAPEGGFSLEIPHEVLCRCRTPEHVVAFFETMMGDAQTREARLARWNEMVDAARIEWPELAAAIRLTRMRKEMQDGERAAA